MSGGLGGSIGFAVIGAGYVIGGAAVVTAQIAKMGSLAAYEQIQLAKECTAEVHRAKEARMKAIDTYARESERILSEANERTMAEIIKVKRLLEERGCQISLSKLGHNNEEVLISLLTMKQSLFGKKKLSAFRSPVQVFHSIVEIIDPLFLYIPSTDDVYDVLTSFKARASSILSNENLPLEEKSNRLREMESTLLSQLDSFKLIARKYEYLFVQFTMLSHAYKRLSEACSDIPHVQRRFDPQNAEKQIQTLRKEIESAKKAIKEKMLSDQHFIEENKHLAESVNHAVVASGYRLISTEAKPYGITSLFSFNQSFLKVTISKEGMLSMDLVGKSDESKQQIFVDEKAFCSEALPKIRSKFSEMGMVFQPNQIIQLTEDSILYENEFLIDEFQDQQRDRGQFTMYADGEGMAQHI